MTTRKRRTTPRRRSSTRSRSTRRRASPASTIGTAVGAAVAGLLVAALTGLPWWGWILLIVVGLAGGALWAARRGRPDPVDEPPSPPPS